MNAGIKTIRAVLLRLTERQHNNVLEQKYASAEPPLRAELFSADQMERHGKTLADSHKLLATPISRSMSSEQTNTWRRQPPCINFFSRLQLLTASVSSIHGCDESRQTPRRKSSWGTPIGIKRAAMKRPVALAAWPPQKNVGAEPCPMGSSQTRGCRRLGADPWLARVAGDPLLPQIGDGDLASHSDQMAVAPVPKSGLAGRRRDSCEAARHVKRFALLQNVEARPRQLVCQRLDRHHVVRLRLLPFVEALCLGAVAQQLVPGRHLWRGCQSDSPAQCRPEFLLLAPPRLESLSRRQVPLDQPPQKTQDRCLQSGLSGERPKTARDLMLQPCALVGSPESACANRAKGACK